MAVARGLPSPNGLFDILGNVSEWCYDVYYATHPDMLPERSVSAPGFRALAQYPVRGNDYVSSARMVRSANRRPASPTESMYSRGFRIAHTVDPKPAQPDPP
jgi:formylglycine-generating enzyme required for sulfatase activity